jgi:hypothetical protein
MNDFNFNIKTPCKNCPFRNDIPSYLTKTKAKAITKAIKENDKTFSCHKTVYNENFKKIKNKPQSHCAGALIMLINEGALFNNVLYRLAVIGKLLNLDELDKNAPVFKNSKEFIQEQL